MKDIAYKDEFLSDDEAFDVLYQCYKNDPSDENFLNVLSSPVCEENGRFVEIEKNFSFPKTSFEHFDLSKKILKSVEKYQVLLMKDGEHVNGIENKVMHKINLDFV